MQVLNKLFPIQTKLQSVVATHPIEIFKWGTSPDHYKIEMPHRHEFDELLFFTEGGGIHEIDFKEYCIEKHSIHFIPRKSLHAISRSRESRGFTLAFDHTHLEQNHIHSFFNPLSENEIKNGAFVLNLSEVHFTEILFIFKLLESQTKKTSSYFQEKCFLISFELLLNAIADAMKKEKSVDMIYNIENPLCSRFIDLVQSYIYESRSVNWYAKKLYVSAPYLSNLIKTELGISPKQFITACLLQSVKRQLLNTRDSINIIAFQHNTNLTSLGKLFKKNMGSSMTLYRKKKSKF